MKPAFKHHPNEYAHRSLLIKFNAGTPLSCDELNFISRHEKALSHEHLDPLLRYYLKDQKKHADDHSFLLHQNELDEESIKKLKKRVQLLLSGSDKKIQIQLTRKEFATLQRLAFRDLIYYHGNQLLTGAPFFPGGIPQLIYFQWGNLFGVAKYVILPEEVALHANVLVYFEEMQERQLNECVESYQKREIVQDQFVLKQELKHVEEPLKQPVELPHPTHRMLYDLKPHP